MFICSIWWRNVYVFNNMKGYMGDLLLCVYKYFNIGNVK